MTLVGRSASWDNESGGGPKLIWTIVPAAWSGSS
jgi:hypothetical protein